MQRRHQSRARLGIEELEYRATPAVLAPLDVPWCEVALDHSARVRHLEQTSAPSRDRPFHMQESGVAVFNPDGTISASASGTATHLGAFTLHDTSTVTGVEVTPDGVILHVVGEAELEAANGDKLYASFTGSVNLTTGQGTLFFEWTGGEGRFADATGATVWQVSLNPDLTYTAVADGVINY